MTIDAVFVFQCGLAVSLGMASQSFLDTNRLRSRWLYAALFFALCLSGVSLSAYKYSLSLALEMSPGVLLVSSVSLLTGLACKLARFSFVSTFGCVVGAIGAGSLMLYWWDVHPELAKFSVSLVVFSLICFWERRAKVEHFLYDIARAALMSLLLFPLVLLSAAALFLLFAALADAVGLPRAIANTVVFYGIFHAPNVVMMLLFFRYQAARPAAVADEDSIV